MNYDDSEVGVPFVRVTRFTVIPPDAKTSAQAVVEQAEAVRLADGSIRTLENIPPVNYAPDFADPQVGEVITKLLALFRVEQLKAEEAEVARLAELAAKQP